MAVIGVRPHLRRAPLCTPAIIRQSLHASANLQLLQATRTSTQRCSRRMAKQVTICLLCTASSALRFVSKHSHSEHNANARRGPSRGFEESPNRNVCPARQRSYGQRLPSERVACNSYAQTHCRTPHPSLSSSLIAQLNTARC